MRKIYKFKKGMPVPSWVQYIECTNNDKAVDYNCYFMSNGKLTLLPDGDIVMWVTKRASCVIYFNPEDQDATCKMIGAGNNDNTCHIYGFNDPRFSGSKLARINHGIKNTTKCELLPDVRPALYL